MLVLSDKDTDTTVEWWMVDLGTSECVGKVVLYNRNCEYILGQVVRIPRYQFSSRCKMEFSFVVSPSIFTNCQANLVDLTSFYVILQFS